jgi:hypothetical protein
MSVTGIFGIPVTYNPHNAWRSIMIGDADILLWLSLQPSHAREEVGTSMDNLEDAKVEAVEALVELANRASGTLRHQLAIEVRDGNVPLLNVVMTIGVKQFV